MGRCRTCGKRIGLFGRKWRRVDRAKHCTQCVPDVMDQRREKTMNAIMADPAPRVVLAAPVISRDLDYPSNYRRYTGLLLLTDKGVIFAQHGEYKKAQSGAALFGLVGAVFDTLIEKGRREAASGDPSDADPSTARALLDQAEQLFLFEVSDIRKLKGNNSYIEVKLHGGTTVFRWVDGRESIKPHRLVLDAYVQAVNAGRDIMADCEQALRA